MKIVHLCANNLQIFEDALEGTGCKVCGTRKPSDARKAFAMYNARDVMGLVVYRQYLTKRLLSLIRAFDDMFVFDPKPIVLVCDDAEELCKTKVVKTKNSPLFAVNSVDGTISDIDICQIFTTLSCLSNEMYDLSEIGCVAEGRRSAVSGEQETQSASLLADTIIQKYAELERGSGT